MPSPKPLSTPVIASLAGATRSFGDMRALDRVDLELRAGEIVALLGTNGAGKSTAVAVILGLRRLDAGSALLFGRDPRDPVARRRLGAVLQDVGYPPGLRVRDAARLVLAHHPPPRSVSEVLARVGLEPFADRDAGGLSGGQRRRLAAGLALAGDPRALVLDEPTAGLDPLGRRELLQRLVRFAGEGGAVLVTTQELAEAEAIATRVVVLDAGRVVHDGSPGELRAHGGITRVVFRTRDPVPHEGTASVESRGDRYVVWVEDADRYVAALVRSGVEFRELEVTPATLEDAFVALTTDGP
jgi:ABC-2 type transport system ATP-binding protein